MTLEVCKGIKYKILSKIVPFRAEEKQKQKPTNNGTTYLSPPEHSLNLNPVLCSILTEN